MTSETRHKSNQANALKSTGPRSARGKATVSDNALRYGILRQHLIVAPDVISRYQSALDNELDKALRDAQTWRLSRRTLVT